VLVGGPQPSIVLPRELPLFQRRLSRVLHDLRSGSLRLCLCLTTWSVAFADTAGASTYLHCDPLTFARRGCRGEGLRSISLHITHATG
jgi:hypothetical protein